MSKPTAPRRVKDNEAMAIGRVVRSSPRKLNLLAQLIRGKKAERALNALTFSKRRIAVEVKKVLLAAIANAENNHNLDVDQLVVTHASVGKSFKLKRWHARGRGRSAGIEKPFSNITIVVREEAPKPKDEKSGRKAGAKGGQKGDQRRKAEGKGGAAAKTKKTVGETTAVQEGA